MKSFRITYPGQCSNANNLVLECDPVFGQFLQSKCAAENEGRTSKSAGWGAE